MTATNQPHRILVSSLWVMYNMMAPAERCARFLGRSEGPFRHLIDGILFSDEILVPTQDFMAIPILVRSLGPGPLIELLESGCLKFIRLPAAVGYSGNGVGLLAFGVEYPDGRQRPITASIEDSARAAMESVSIAADQTLITALGKATTELDVESTFTAIEKETYQDVRESDILRKSFALRNRDFRRLAGIAPNQVRIYGGPDVEQAGDEIETLLSLATANVELKIAEAFNCYDTATSSPVQGLLRGKIDRLARSSAVESFAKLRRMADIPDIGPAVIRGNLDLRRLLKLRTSGSAGQFRQWFHDHKGDDPVLLAKEYISLLREVPGVQSMPVRIIRYIVSTAVGFIPVAGLLAGPTVSALDSFFVDRLFGQNSARFFLDQLRDFSGRDT